MMLAAVFRNGMKPNWMGMLNTALHGGMNIRVRNAAPCSLGTDDLLAEAGVAAMMVAKARMMVVW